MRKKEYYVYIVSSKGNGTIYIGRDLRPGKEVYHHAGATCRGDFMNRPYATASRRFLQDQPRLI